MENSQILENLKNAIVELDLKKAEELCKYALSQNIDPILIIENGIAQALKKVGEKFEAEEYFITELIMAGETSTRLMKILIPRLNVSKSSRAIGKVVIGTGKGDIHDIGKDIVKFLLDANGYEVLDLGVDVPPETFVEKMKEFAPQVVALSGFLTLAFDAMKDTIEQMKNAGLRDLVKIMIGGGTIDERIVSYVGADAYGDTAMDAVKLADKWIGGV